VTDPTDRATWTREQWQAMCEQAEAEAARLRQEVSQKQKRENVATGRAERAERHVASLQLENENLRALVVHLGCPNCHVGEIALAIHRMMFSGEHAHGPKDSRTFILKEDDKR
jgi:hypothetical protein